MSKATELNLAEIVLRIQKHLTRMENSSFGGDGPSTFWRSRAWCAGRYVAVKYVSYQMTVNLTKAEASAYLSWLDAGNEGTHYKMERAA